MGDVGWDQEDCQANAKVEIDVDCDDTAGTLDKKIESLKLNQHLSTVRVLLPNYRRPFEHRHKKVIDGLLDLLKTNINIKNLKVEDALTYKSSPISARVLEMLANGDAGDNLEYLWYNFHELSTSEADSLQRFTKTNHNLRRLRIHVDDGPASPQLVSYLSGTKITELCLKVWPYITEAVWADILDLIKASNSIANVRFEDATPGAFRDSIESFCILNRVFGTN